MLPHPPSCTPCFPPPFPPPPRTAAAGPRGGCSSPHPLGRRCRSAGVAMVASAGCRQRCLSRCPAGRERGDGAKGRRCARRLWKAAPEGEQASAVRCGLLPSPARRTRHPASVAACVLIGAIAPSSVAAKRRAAGKKETFGARARLPVARMIRKRVA